MKLYILKDHALFTIGYTSIITEKMYDKAVDKTHWMPFESKLIEPEVQIKLTPSQFDEMFRNYGMKIPLNAVRERLFRPLSPASNGPRNNQTQCPAPESLNSKLEDLAKQMAKEDAAKATEKCREARNFEEFMDSLPNTDSAFDKVIKDALKERGKQGFVDSLIGGFLGTRQRVAMIDEASFDKLVEEWSHPGVVAPLSAFLKAKLFSDKK